MKSLWLYISLIFIVQEQVSTDAIILQIKQQHLSLWPVHLAWIAFTAFDIYIAYALGQWCQKKLKNTKLGITLDKAANRLEKSIGYRGENVMIIILGIINFPYINAFLCSWLNLNFKRTFVLILIGDIISYIITWETVSWLKNTLSTSLFGSILVIILSILLMTALRALFSKIQKTKK